MKVKEIKNFITNILTTFDYKANNLLCRLERKLLNQDEYDILSNYNKSWLTDILYLIPEKDLEKVFTLKNEEKLEKYCNIEDGVCCMLIKVFDLEMPIYVDDAGQQYVGKYNDNYVSGGSYNTDIMIFIDYLINEYVETLEKIHSYVKKEDS